MKRRSQHCWLSRVVAVFAVVPAFVVVLAVALAAFFFVALAFSWNKRKEDKLNIKIRFNVHQVC